MYRWTAGLLFALTAALAAPPPPDPAAVAEVKAGARTVAHATWWGFDPTNATAALQAAFDSGAREVIVDDVGQPWIVDGLRPRSNTVITFAKGCELQARREQFKGTGDCLMTLSQVEHVTLSGYGATFRMWRDDYADPARYKKAEWRHCVSILSSRNIKVLGLRLTESGGDGIYLGVAKAGVTNDTVLIKDVTCERHYRQGISVICAANLTIEDTILRDTAGTAPMAGIDFEPNREDEQLTNCVMRGCTIEGNLGGGIALYLVPLTGKSKPVSMRFERCITRGNSSAVGLSTTNGGPNGDPTGRIEFVGCRFERPERRGIEVRDKPADGIALSFVDCELIEPAPTQPTATPILLSARRGARHALGNVTFDRVLVRDALGRAPLGLDGWTGSLPVERVSGRLRLAGADGVERTVELTPDQLKVWLPESGLLSLPAYPDKPLQPLVTPITGAPYSLASARIRGKGTWLLHAAAGDSVACALRYSQVGRYDGDPMRVTIAAPSGRALPPVTAAFGQETPIRFTAPETGTYRLAADSGRNQVALSASTHPVAVTGDDGTMAFCAADATLWLWVPAGVQQFAVTCFGDGAEGVRASLLDATGKVIDSQDNIGRPKQFTVRRPAGSPGEAWRLALARPTAMAFEDFGVQIQGVPPLLSPAREALLVPMP